MITKFRKHVCVLLSVCMVASPELILAQEATNVDRSDLRQKAIRLIPSDATGAFVAFPRSAMTAPSMVALPTEVFSAMGKEEFGLDPLEIEIAVGAVRVQGTGMPDGAIGLKFRTPISLDDLNPEVIRGLNHDELNGKPFLSTPDGQFGLTFPSNSTVLFGTPGMLQRMLKRQGTASGEVHKYLLQDAPQDLQVVVTLESIRELVNAQIQQLPMLPGGLEALKRLPDHTEAVSLRGHANPFGGEVALHAIDNRAGDEIERILTRALDTGKAMAREAVRYNFKGDSELDRASQAYANRMIEMFAAQIAPSRDGDKIMLAGNGENQAEIAVIAMLVTLLLPAIQAAREAARRTNAMNRGRSVSLALLNYESAMGHLPLRAIYDKQGKPLLSWRVTLLPFLEENELYQEFHLDEPWDSPHNKKLIPRMPPIYCHETEVSTAGKTHFLGIAGKQKFLFDTESTKVRGFGHIVDGTSKSLAFVEADDAVIWTKPEDLMVDLENPKKGLGKLRPGGIFSAFFLDGHSEFVSISVDAEKLKAMFTINGGELVR